MKTEKELWTRVINDARFYDGSPHDLEKLIKHFKSIGINVTEQNCIKHDVMQGWPDFQTAQRLLAIRDELVKGNIHEAYHQLCLIADPELENLNHWQKLETIAQGQPTVASEGLDKNA